MTFLSEECGCGGWTPKRGLTRRAGLFGCFGLGIAASLPDAAHAEPYPALIADIRIDQVPDAPIWYTIGSFDVPGERNEGHTSNAGFIVTDDGVVVFDSLGTPALGNALLAKIRSVTDKPVRYVVVSHYHADHIYGLQAFRDQTKAVILSQEKGLSYTDQNNLDDENADARLAQRREALAPWVNAETRIVTPELTFRVASEISLGKHLMQIVYAGPAHSMSDVMMLVLPERILFAGDIVQNGRVPFMASAAVNTRNWQASLAQVAALKPRFVIPGHGKTHASAEEAIRFTSDYISYVRDRMGDAVANWVAFDDAYKAADWSAYAGMPAFAENNRGNAYRVFLEIEAESLASGGDAAKP
jgi:glyoxylase-like metal-dependent hydrolase (beta-lactamase superfamily II)